MSKNEIGECRTLFNAVLKRLKLAPRLEKEKAKLKNSANNAMLTPRPA